MRYKRSERIVFMTQYLMNHPNKLIPLTFFVKKFKQAKSSISEDVQIIKNTFQKEKLGTVITTAGASGGVTYKPMMSKEEATEGHYSIRRERTFVTWRVFIFIRFGR